MAGASGSITVEAPVRRRKQESPLRRGNGESEGVADDARSHFIVACQTYENWQPGGVCGGPGVTNKNGFCARIRKRPHFRLLS
jgi:hypothetical protein